MVFQGLILLLYIFAFAAGCMALVLSVVFHLRENLEWTKYLLLFESSLLAVIGLNVFIVFMRVFASEFVKMLFIYIIEPVIIADIAFLIVFIPYFISWIFAIPWRIPFALISYILSGAYIVLRVLDLVLPTITIFGPVSAVIFILSLFLALSLPMRNLKDITNHLARIMAKVVLIVTLSMIPLVLITLLFPFLLDILYAAFYLAFNVIMIVFLFIYFRKMPQKINQEITLEDAKAYRITEREYSVILLIREGYTNKEIAEELTISVNTVNNHVANIFSKTNVRSRIDLLNLLQKEGP